MLRHVLLFSQGFLFYQNLFCSVYFLIYYKHQSFLTLLRSNQLLLILIFVFSLACCFLLVGNSECIESFHFFVFSGEYLFQNSIAFLCYSFLFFYLKTVFHLSNALL